MQSLLDWRWATTIEHSLDPFTVSTGTSSLEDDGLVGITSLLRLSTSEVDSFERSFVCRQSPMDNIWCKMERTTERIGQADPFKSTLVAVRVADSTAIHRVDSMVIQHFKLAMNHW